MFHSLFFTDGEDDEPTIPDDVDLVEAGDYTLDDDIGGKIDKDDSSEQAV